MCKNTEIQLLIIVSTLKYIMKVFNGRSATEEYMSTHSLTFSTPEMTLKKFALWLGDQIASPGDSKKNPRLMSYIEDISDNDEEKITEISPNVDDSFKPSGAVTDMYGTQPVSKLPNSQQAGRTVEISSDVYSGRRELQKPNDRLKVKYCSECGNSVGTNAKFCSRCGNRQI